LTTGPYRSSLVYLSISSSFIMRSPQLIHTLDSLISLLDMILFWFYYYLTYLWTVFINKFHFLHYRI
jgi:hypothetical protein